ncbi:DUF4363 family protein [Bacillota bacterium LX-D]|nr:DUF4363 family protein [Bacillota bacterium LX-D]
MKVVASLLLFTLCIVGFGVWSISYINNSAQDLTTRFDNLEQNIIQQNWSKADTETKKIAQLWSDTKSRWTLFLNHQEIDNIDLTYARLTKYVETQNRSLALAEISALKLLIEHIPGLQRFSLNNIF